MDRLNRIERLIASPLGALVARPWFDHFTIRFFGRWFFPVSRLWAAAREANGEVEDFYTSVPIDPIPRLNRRIGSLLRNFELRRLEEEGRVTASPFARRRRA